MASHISIQIKGELHLGDFITEMKALSDALKYSERHITGDERGTYTRFEIVDLHHSDATVEMQAVPIRPSQDFTEGTLRTFFDVAAAIGRGEPPDWIDVEGLLVFKDLGKIINPHTPAVVLTNSKRAVQITEGFGPTVDTIVGPDQIAQGSIRGMLEMLSVHRQPYQFALYPTIGPRRVVCGFDPKRLDQVISAIGRYVEILGLLKYKARGSFAYAVEDVRGIDILPTNDELPTMAELAGIANGLDDLTIEEFIETFSDAN
jgi:hypothetical protein